LLAIKVLDKEAHVHSWMKKPQISEQRPSFKSRQGVKMTFILPVLTILD